MEPRRVDCWIRVFASVLVRLCQPSNACSTLPRTCDEPRAQQFTTRAEFLLLALLLLALLAGTNRRRAAVYYLRAI